MLHYRAHIWLLILLVARSVFFCQELYPLNEPASTLPKKAIGVRSFARSYKEADLLRNMFGLRMMYGLTSKLTVMATGCVSNHHGGDFPPKLVSHVHNGNQTVYSTGNFQRGIQYPYQFSGIYLYAKYRFITRDGQNEHFRMSVYADWSNVDVAHDEAEPNLMDDTKGYGGGLIATYLKKRFAASFTGGVIKAGSYDGFSPDSIGPKVPTKVQYGNALIYNLSFGYLLLPRHYTNYNQPNFNIYVELLGKSYQAAQVTQYGFQEVPIQTPLLKAGNYVDIHPGIQAIFNSNLRLDLTAGFPLINRSYTHFYPVFYFAVQRYFYPGVKNRSKK